MIIDSSALLAVVFKEPGYERLVASLAESQAVGVGAPTLVETALVLGARLGSDSRPLTGRLVQELGLTVVGFGEDHWREAAGAWFRFGKGRHPAALNFGDCMTYAVARLAGQPLLCVGNDFSHTDLQLA